MARNCSVVGTRRRYFVVDDSTTTKCNVSVGVPVIYKRTKIHIKPTMSLKEKKIIEAITSFIEDVEAQFGTDPLFGDDKQRIPLLLFHRVTTAKLDLGDNKKKMLACFEKFFKVYDSQKQLRNLPLDARITFQSEKPPVWIDVGRMMSISNDDTKNALVDHLRVMSALIFPTKEKLEDLDRALSETNLEDENLEEKFVDNILSQAKNVAKSAENNPAQLMGYVNNIISEMQNAQNIESMNPEKVMAAMQGMLMGVVAEAMSSTVVTESSELASASSAALTSKPQPPKIEEVDD